MFLGPKIKYFRRDECLYTTIISLNRLLQLGFETLFCGHNPQTKHTKAMLARKRDHLLDLQWAGGEALSLQASLSRKFSPRWGMGVNKFSSSGSP